ncbi:MAG: hypothetical protein HGA35_04440, partial [Erysipelotrichaceae bacterium]|nr:hypothetical protein [Erysipelotrichaceae bacterium]
MKGHWQKKITALVIEFIILFGFWLLLSGHYDVSHILMGIFSTAAMAGSFRAAISMSVLIGFSITLLNIVSGPIISRTYSQKKIEALQYILAFIVVGMFMGVALIVLPLLIFG